VKSVWYVELALITNLGDADDIDAPLSDAIQSVCGWDVESIEIHPASIVRNDQATIA
jgi:hypothetical protein